MRRARAASDGVERGDGLVASRSVAGAAERLEGRGGGLSERNRVGGVVEGLL